MCAPTLAFVGVPGMVVPEIVIVLGAPLIEYVKLSPESTSVQTLATLKLYAASSAVERHLRLQLLVIVYVGYIEIYSSMQIALLPSVHVTVIVCAPTLALTGVPEIVVPEIGDCAWSTTNCVSQTVTRINICTCALATPPD